MWRVLRRLLLASLFVASFFVGWRMGHGRGVRNATVQQLVLQAGSVAEEIHGLRRSSVNLPSGFLDEREQLLQVLLANLTQRVAPKDLAQHERSMEVMHYVQQYRRTFPYMDVVGHRVRELPTWPSSIHADIERFLNALPPPKASAQRRLDDLFAESHHGQPFTTNEIPHCCPSPERVRPRN
ncbi:MAG: hypothetical protein ISS35_09085 [Kiritimatiellae bacterium]|nr:hypothetical protein [Kiritimatiellia bacterium]